MRSSSTNSVLSCISTFPFIVFGLLWLLITPLYAQKSQLIKGKIINNETKLPVAYTTIRILGKPVGATSDMHGKFSFYLSGADSSNARLMCSSVGYNTYTMIIPDKSEVELLISLVPTSYMLEEVFIYPGKKRKIEPEKIIRQAMRTLTKTCPPHQAIANMQHYILEDNRYRKITEAKIRINDPVGFGRNLRPEIPREYVTYIEKRESLDLSVDRIDFKRGYFDIYLNPFRFLLHNGLKYKFGSNTYVYSIEDTLYFDEHITYIISAKDKEPILSTNSHFVESFDMKFHVEENSRNKYEFNIVRFELNFQSKTEYNQFTQSDNRTFTLDLKKFNSYYQPSTIEHILIQNTKWENDPSSDGQMLAYHKIDIEEVNFEAKDLRVVLPNNNSYNAGFWENNPLEKNIARDLSEIIPIQDQFQLQYDKQAVKRLQDSVDYVLVNKKLKEILGDKTAYLIFWDNWETLMDFRQFPDWISRRDLELIFIGSFIDKRDWSFIITGGEFSFFKHFNMPYSWQKFLAKESPNKLPLYVIINKNGQKSYSSTPFSKEYLNTLD